MIYNKSIYFVTSDKQKIKYFFLQKKSQITVVFFHGFMSNMNGAKPIAIQSFCKKYKLNFLRFEYSGHGKSTGNFIDGNISKWSNDSKELIKNKTKKNHKLIFIGSSMGSWIALNLFKVFKKQISGFIGISSAPEFLERLMWKKFSKKIKKEVISKKIYYLKIENFTYPLTKQLIFDGKKNKVLNKNINFKFPIVLFHCLKDSIVPLDLSKKLIKLCKSPNKKLVKIKNGDHSLSKKKNIKKICYELRNMILNHL